MPSGYYSSSTVCTSISIQFRRKQNYMENYLKPYKWTYLNEVVQSNIAGNQRVGNFKITNGISKPRRVFANPFLYNTFSVFTNLRTLDSCYLEV